MKAYRYPIAIYVDHMIIDRLPFRDDPIEAIAIAHELPLGSGVAPERMKADPIAIQVEHTIIDCLPFRDDPVEAIAIAHKLPLGSGVAPERVKTCRCPIAIQVDHVAIDRLSLRDDPVERRSQPGSHRNEQGQ